MDNMYLLMVGDYISRVGSKDTLSEAYLRRVKEYKDSGKRPSLKPVLWKAVKPPK